MFEYDKELKLKSLSIWGFDIKSLDTEKIVHVPMHQYRIATKEEPMLYVDNLQCCIGLYAYGNNFGFAAHINPVIMRGDEYELDNRDKVIRCRRMEDLKSAILNSHFLLGAINIGISLGCSPLDENYPTVKMIHDGIDNLMVELNSMGIITQKIKEQSAPEFILDTITGEIILPKNHEKVKCKR